MSLISITSKYCITTGHWPTQIWKISFRRLNLAIYLHIISSKWLSVDCRSSAISHYYLWPRSKKLFDRTFYENRQESSCICNHLEYFPWAKETSGDIIKQTNNCHANSKRIRWHHLSFVNLSRLAPKTTASSIFKYVQKLDWFT